MSVEKIINQIEIDTDKEVKKILNEAKKQAEIIMKNEQKKAEIQSEIIISNGVKKSDSIKQIIISKENQLAKKSITKTKEKIIEKCFTDAFNKFKNCINKIGNDCSVKISKEIDKKITKKFGLKLIGQVNSIGGIILISNDGKVTLDYTIEGIIKREKDRIRIKIGKILFK
jgi:V/A-type H+-transporting ATPase subunit E